ncbi:MAG: amino acid ABC transporter substrate-binding protein [Burkholderiaceae bacterium]|jgi:glutamate/aspartate transport system substrate-binding protein|nr:amino acid ABC transporter substrate-binding protein [Burkholderiaceae bacterium]MCZ8175373.1 amino acid ABC transporter substrate-binding protein [Burkholderiaceae bacterium]
MSRLHARVLARSAFAATLLALLPTAWAQTLDKVKASGSIAVAYRESSIPFSYLDDKAQPVGFGWEICQRIVDEVRKATGRADLKVTTQAVTSANRIPLLMNGTIDIECGSTTNNSDRAKQVTFATNYFYTGTRLLVKAGSPIKGVADLRGRKVVSTTGTTNFRIMRALNEERNLGFELMGAKDHAESQLVVGSGRADAFAMDDILLYGLAASAANPAEWAVVGEAIQVEPYAIMLRKDDPTFKALVDGVLARLMDSGEFERLYTRWFLQPIPPKGVNLNAPMPRELRDNLRAKSDKPAT